MKMLIAVCVVFWGVTLVHLCSRRDIEIHRKLSWVVTILVLNALGALLYVVFGPKRQRASLRGPEVPPFEPEGMPKGMTWDPLVGGNRFSDERELNSQEETSPNQPPEATR